MENYPDKASIRDAVSYCLLTICFIERINELNKESADENPQNTKKIVMRSPLTQTQVETQHKQ
jgi:hypothetical protein